MTDETPWRLGRLIPAIAKLTDSNGGTAYLSRDALAHLRAEAERMGVTIDEAGNG